MGKSRLGLCSTCKQTDSKYRCPRCEECFCSLDCSRKHKVEKKCSGVRNPAKFLPKSQLVQSLNSDYNFLTRLEGALTVADKQNASQAGKLQKKHSLIQKIYESNNIGVRFAPSFTQRSKDNRTYFHRQNKVLMCSIDWCLHTTSERQETEQPQPLKSTFTNHGNASTSTLQELWNRAKEQWLQLASEDKIEQPKISMDEALTFVVHVSTSKKLGPVYRPLNSSLSLLQCLAGSTVLEYPVVHIFTHSCKLVTEHDVSELEESSDDENSTDSESCTESSDSEESTSGESDSSEMPSEHDAGVSALPPLFGSYLENSNSNP
ncbi:snoRNA biogenesis protein [Schizosaccharomyces japonicus yFS275]|uniref:SnoRNA biogenesis protein n=1 Tax=Schizosaccharomyces japonicus (strain yFS275 / FY16936) TaxID=402676 RepID=B6JWH6_SCHJY|nr:snoRNA biogenesis protein [Schizosaccharomyces japonicus yFS275]EEB05727.1 snoRNA biogenesis protein [Schizosaccharomyces japonicus yFS275]